MTNIAVQSLSTIVTNNHFTVAVLEKYNLDYCCKGKRTLADACTEQGLSVDTIAVELEKASTASATGTIQFTEMNASELVSYILMHHHVYVKQSMPVILGHLEKIVAKYGDHYPYMTQVLLVFRKIKEEMTEHMHKEEVILFPRIIEVDAMQDAGQRRKLPDDYISGPIQIMETDDEHTGELLNRIRKLTNNYIAPADSSTTFKVSLAELKEFEEDLQRHVHLENNILFPLAEKIMTQQIN